MRKLENFSVDEIIAAYLFLKRAQQEGADVHSDNVDLVKNGLQEIGDELNLRSSRELAAYILETLEYEE